MNLSFWLTDISTGCLGQYHSVGAMMIPVPWLADCGAVEDLQYVRAATNELFVLVGVIDGVCDMAAASPEVDLERAAGMQEVKALVLERVRQLRRRYTELSKGTPAELVGETVACGPVLVSPKGKRRHTLPHGVSVMPMVTAPMAPTRGISSTGAWLAPWSVATPHVHPDTDVIVVLEDAQDGVVTLWWDGAGVMHVLVQRPGEHLLIPRGVAHCGANPSDREVRGSEFWSDPCLGDDICLRPELAGAAADWLVVARQGVAAQQRGRGDDVASRAAGS